ncbi:MAG TPA: carotenoid biosynthesis protein [Gemmatimonadaceae bacterium]
MTRRARTAWALFAAHVGLILFSTAAMLTVLSGSAAFDTTSEPAATIMRVSFAFAGPTYVVLGTMATLAFLWSRVRLRDAVAVAATASALALGAELVGTSVGLPFGDYTYSGLLGYRILGLVPFPIPLSWFYMLVGSLSIVARLSPDRKPWRWALGAGLLMVAWDISMDPAMVKTGHWLWGSGEMVTSSGLPRWLVSFFTADAFYGMPLSNWFGWLLTATLVARAMLVILPPAVVRDKVASSRFPIALYLANGVMPVALCLRDGFWWAAVVGALAMIVPAAVALRHHGMRREVRLSPPQAA